MRCRVASQAVAFAHGACRGKQKGTIMRAVLASLVALGLMAAPVLAGSTHTPMRGTLGNPFNDGQMHGWGWTAQAGAGGSGELGNLYDNILTINGGAATAGFYGPFDDIPGTEAFLDWVGTQAHWGDDLHGISGGPGNTAVVTRLRYGYANLVATTTHIIKIYDMVFPSAVPTFSTLILETYIVMRSVISKNRTAANR